VSEDLQLVERRQAWLLDRLKSERRVTTNDAAADCGVSVDTIRRDLRQLHDRGLLRRVHGGAVPIARLPASFSERTTNPSASGTALAAAIVGHFTPGQVIGLDGGSTCVEIAATVPSSLAVSIVTNNPAAAVALSGHPSATVIMLGGHLDLTWMATTGADTVDGWRNYRLDIGVVGLCGLDADIGATTNSSDEVSTKRALIDASSRVIVPVQREKIGVCAPFVVTDLGSIDIVVTDGKLPDTLARACAAHGTEIVDVSMRRSQNSPTQ
jgi:DeoR/GlpR family transcriptional regulator of sugar metabolism